MFGVDEIDKTDKKVIEVVLEEIERAVINPKNSSLKTITLWDDDLESLKDILKRLL